jgi:hypothetical protein
LNSSDLLITIGKVLEENQDLKDWCNTNFSKPQTVYLGLDTENPPAQEDYPLIMVFYVERLRGESDTRQTFSVEIGAGIFKKELVKPEATQNPNLKAYTGLLLVEQFRELVEDTLFKSMPKIGGKIDVTGETTTEVYYPFFRSNTLVSADFVRTSRTPLGNRK